MPVDAGLRGWRTCAQICGDLCGRGVGRRVGHCRCDGQRTVRCCFCFGWLFWCFCFWCWQWQWQPRSVSDSQALESVATPAAPAKRKKPVKQFVVRHLLSPIARTVYGGMARSWHYTTEHEPVLTSLLAGDKPIVGAFLHARTFQLLYYISRPHRGRWMLMC